MSSSGRRTAALATALASSIFAPAAGGNPAAGSPVGRVVQRVTVSGVSAIGSGGQTLWLAQSGRVFGRVLRVDPGARRPRSWTRTGAAPQRLAVGFGSVWVVNSQVGGRRAAGLFRIDVRSPRIRARVTVPAMDRVATGQGATWVLSDALRMVFKIDVRRDRVLHRVALGRGTPLDIALVGHTLWVALEVEGPDGRLRTVLARVDTRTGRIRSTTRLSWPVRQLATNGRTVCGAAALGIVCWNGDDLGRRFLLRVAPVGNIALDATSVWFTQRGWLRRIPLGSRKVVGGLRIGASADQLASSQRGMWVVDSLGGQIILVARSGLKGR